MKNVQFKPGTEVIRWAIVRQNGEKERPTLTTVTTNPGANGFSANVVGVEGLEGGVSLLLLEEATPENIIKATMNGLEIDKTRLANTMETVFQGCEICFFQREPETFKREL